MRKAESCDDEEAPRSERDDLEDADDVVDRRVVGPLLVAVVQPVDPGEQHPERQAQRRRARSPTMSRTTSTADVDGHSTSASRNAVGSPTRSAMRSKRRMSHPRRRKGSAEAAWLVW